jgi:hypothetical protein
MTNIKHEPKKSFLRKVTALIRAAAKKYGVKPYEVTTAQFWSVAEGKIAEWEIRKVGGFTGIRGLEFPAPLVSRNDIIIPQSQKKTPKYKPPRLENFTVYPTDIRTLFKSAKLKDSDVLRVVVQPDSHVPEHDEHAMTAFCKFLDFYKPHGLINLGDFVENESVSHWEPKNPKPRRLVPEILVAKELLTRIDKAAGPQCIYKRYLIGNHEDWLDFKLTNKLPEVYDGIESLGVALLGLKEMGYRVIPLNEILRLGELHFIHGYYTNKYHAHKHLEVFGVNIMYGHVHDVQSYSGVSVSGVHEAISIGCLRNLNAQFMKGKPNNWSHAFGIVEYTIDGRYTRYVPIIIDGRFSFQGNVFDGRK